MSSIRYAKPSDAKRLAALAEATFRDTFGSVNAVEDMNLHCRASYGEAIQSAEISNAGIATLLCDEGGNLAAFAQLRWSAAPACVSAQNPGEIQRLYVAKSWHGKGMAHDLMAACIGEMENRKSDVVWLGVWERNPRAIAFYKKFGFVEVGDHVFPLGTDPQRDIIMSRLVSNRPPGT
ncbi:GNAT family N-acetyltransferase [Rhodanobacter soli]|uniref:GNAT family N-acetyltransferase n=1 Tax=Rhodanobacter soli TaxID=590609 RepID=UPI0031D40C25